MNYILLQAATTPSAKGFDPTQILFFVAIFAIMYFLMIRPQQKRAKEMQKMLDSIQIGDKVVTAAGIVGTIKNIKTDKNIVVIEIADNVKVDFQRSAIVSIIGMNDKAVTQ